MIHRITPLPDGSEVLLGDNGIYFLPPRDVLTRLRLNLNDEPVLPAGSRLVSFVHDSIVIDSVTGDVDRKHPGAKEAIEAAMRAHASKHGVPVDRCLDFEPGSVADWRSL